MATELEEMLGVVRAALQTYFLPLHGTLGLFYSVRFTVTNDYHLFWRLTFGCSFQLYECLASFSALALLSRLGREAAGCHGGELLTSLRVAICIACRHQVVWLLKN